MTAQLAINGQIIGVIAVQRLAPLGQPATDEPCTYRWHVVTDAGEQDGHVEHRYGDGAITLLHKALDARADRARRT